MIANGEDFDFKKAFRCILEATIFFVLCTSIYILGYFKGQLEGAIQCVSFIVYLVLYFYGLNILKNIRKMLKPDTAPYNVIDALYYLLRFKFVERIPLLKDYLKHKHHHETYDN